MAEKRDDEFAPRLKPPRANGAAPPSFVRQVRTLIHRTGSGAAKVGGTKTSRRGPRHGRGRVAARVAGQSFGLRSRRVAVKVRHVKIGGKTSVTRAHVRYLEREGVGADGEPGRAYGRDADQVDCKAFAERCKDDRHQFRMIVSPEEGAELEDLKAFTRSLMKQMEADLQTRLDWVAVDHWDTGHPHTHLLIRGKDQAGSDLLIDREYLTRGVRMRAAEIATEWLGPRTELEIQADWNRQVTAERWTGIDALLERHAVGGNVDRASLADLDPPTRARCLGRLQVLDRMGLTPQVDGDHWQWVPGLRQTLLEMGERGDIIRTLQRAHGRAGEYQILDPDNLSHAIVGRVAAKGLHKEPSDRGYLLIEAMDGHTHYVPIDAAVPLANFPTGAIVRIAPARERTVDLNVAAVAREGIYRTETHRRQMAAANPEGIDSAEFIQSHVRRLEALRRAKIVERLEEGVWRVPPDLAARGVQYDRQRSGGAEIRVLTPMSIDRQRTAIGATWLDQQLIANAQPPATEFGRELAAAMQGRQQVLIDQGLAHRQGAKVLLTSNLLGRLKDKELEATAAGLERSTGLQYRPAGAGVRVTGTYRQSVHLASGKFAVLDDGVGFSLVPWRPVIDKRLGHSLSATIHGSGVSWDIGRSRGLSI